MVDWGSNVGFDLRRFAADEIPMKLSKGLRDNRRSTMPEMLFQTFLETDADFLANQSCNAGTTATVLLWDNQTSIGYIANVGDTRAVLCRGARAVDLTEDKKASNPREIARIARDGGFVINGRVMGSLAVSRALGDLHLKVDSDDEGAGTKYGG